MAFEAYKVGVAIPVPKKKWNPLEYNADYCIAKAGVDSALWLHNHAVKQSARKIDTDSE